MLVVVQIRFESTKNKNHADVFVFFCMNSRQAELSKNYSKNALENVMRVMLEM